MQAGSESTVLLPSSAATVVSRTSSKVFDGHSTVTFQGEETPAAHKLPEDITPRKPEKAEIDADSTGEDFQGKAGNNWETDLENARNWSTARKWTTVCIVRHFFLRATKDYRKETVYFSDNTCRFRFTTSFRHWQAQ